MIHREGRSPREVEILHHLLAQHGITHYRLLDKIPEGSELPGCTYKFEILFQSGTLEVGNTCYSFWLTWENGTYALENWQEKPQPTRLKETL